MGQAAAQAVIAVPVGVYFPYPVPAAIEQLFEAVKYGDCIASLLPIVLPLILRAFAEQPADFAFINVAVTIKWHGVPLRVGSPREKDPSQMVLRGECGGEVSQSKAEASLQQWLPLEIYTLRTTSAMPSSRYPQARSLQKALKASCSLIDYHPLREFPCAEDDGADLGVVLPAIVEIGHFLAFVADIGDGPAETHARLVAHSLARADVLQSSHQAVTAVVIVIGVLNPISAICEQLQELVKRDNGRAGLRHAPRLHLPRSQGPSPPLRLCPAFRRQLAVGFE
jgi:hypothetical protein